MDNTIILLCLIIIFVLIFIQFSSKIFSNVESFQKNNLANNKNNSVNNRNNNENNLANNLLKEDYKPISPVIKRIRKENDKVLVEWDNTDLDNINKFIVLYKNQDTNDNSTWILRNIESNKEKNQLVLEQMFGNRYHLTILSVYENKKEKKVSNVGEIIYFGNDNDYNNLDYKKENDINLDEVDEINNIFKNDLSEDIEDSLAEESNYNSENNLANNLVNNVEENNLAEEEEIKISCDGKTLGKNINTPEQLEKAEVEYDCMNNKEIVSLRDEIANYRPFFSLIFFFLDF